MFSCYAFIICVHFSFVKLFLSFCDILCLDISLLLREIGIDAIIKKKQRSEAMRKLLIAFIAAIAITLICFAVNYIV